MLLIDGVKEYRKEQGESFELRIKEEWANKEITVMPYLQAETINVSVKTQIRTEAIVVFVNGYWNTGKSNSFAEPLKKMIAENIIGTKNKKDYWESMFINNTYNFLIKNINSGRIKPFSEVALLLFLLMEVMFGIHQAKHVLMLDGMKRKNYSKQNY